ncbi:MAG: hypothetical protein LW806_08050, partial [Planctomycetaceae bacterium]|nr:hypothetical protein [Planctomycetaceae bacterium]
SFLGLSFLGLSVLGLSVLGLQGCATGGAANDSSPKPIAQPEGMTLVATSAPPLPPMAQPVSDAQLAREFNNLHSNGAMYFAGWPTEAGMRALAARGVTRIIALKTPDETLAARGYDPRALAKQLGIAFVEMPVNAETLSNAYIDAFAREVDRDGGPTLMYCGSASTCGMVWGSYLARAKGASAADSLAQARAAGLKDGPLADAAQRYIAGATRDAGAK